MEDANKIEEEKVEVTEEKVEATEENSTVEEVKDEEFIEVVGDADEVINEKEEEVK